MDTSATPIKKLTLLSVSAATASIVYDGNNVYWVNTVADGPCGADGRTSIDVAGARAYAREREPIALSLSPYTILLRKLG
jgi:hypothetical protein